MDAHPVDPSQPPAAPVKGRRPAKICDADRAGFLGRCLEYLMPTPFKLRPEGGRRVPDSPGGLALAMDFGNE